MPKTKASCAVLPCLLILLLGHAAAQQDAGVLIAQALAATQPSSSLVQVQLPASSTLTDAASITVPTNTTLVLLGQGNSSTSLLWNISSNSRLPRITVQTGAVLTFANMTVVVSQPVPPTVTSSTSTVQWAQLFSLPGLSMQAGSTLQVANVVMMLSNCSALSTYQDAVCAAVNTSVDNVIEAPQAPSADLFHAPQVRPGCLRFAPTNGTFTAADGGTAFAQIINVRMLCPQSADLSQIVPSLVDPANPILMQLAAQLGRTQCLIMEVHTAKHLLGYSLNATLLTQPQGLVVLQMYANISLADAPWPAQGVKLNSTVLITGPPVPVAANSSVTVSGMVMPAAPGQVELDLAGMPAFLVLDEQQALVLLENMYIVNLAVGADAEFPNSLLVGAVWAVQFDRPSANRTRLLIRNSRLVVPEDLYSYMSYWVGIHSSTVPSVSSTADWLQSIVYFGLTLGGADNHSLIFSRREGEGTLWINSSFTDLPYLTPVTLPSTGIRQLNPNDSLYPLSLVHPIHNASELIHQLLNATSTTSFLMLLSSMQLSAASVAQAAAAAGLKQGVIPITQPLTLIGRPAASVPSQPGIVPANSQPLVLDFGGDSSLFSLSLSQGARITLNRLALAGLGPYNASRSAALGLNTTDTAPSQSVLGNLTSALWAIDSPRHQPSLQLTNTTLVISPYELDAIYQSVATGSTLASIPQPLDPATVAALDKAFGLANLVTSQPDMLLFSDLAFAGITGSNVALQASPTAPTYQLQAPPDTGTTDAGARLSTGGIVGVVIGSVALLAILLLVVWISVKRMRKLRRTVDEERAAKTAALEQVEALSQQGTPAASDATHAVAPSAGTHHSSSRAGSVAAQSLRTNHSLPHDGLVGNGSTFLTTQGSGLQAGGIDTMQSTGLLQQFAAPGTDSMEISKMAQSLDFTSRNARPPQVPGGQKTSPYDASARPSSDLARGHAPPQHPQGPGAYDASARPSSDLARGHAPPEHAQGPGAYDAARPSSAPSAVAQVQPAASETNTSGQRPGGSAPSSTRPVTTPANEVADSEAPHTHEAGVPQIIRGSHVLADVVPFGGVVSQDSQQGPSLALAVEPNSNPFRDSCFDTPRTKGLLIIGTDSVVIAPAQQAVQQDDAKESSTSLSSKGRATAGESSGTGTSSSRQPLIDQGLAAADEGYEPALILQQVIAQRKEMQGIDMQQITFLSVLGQGNFGVVYKGKWRSMTVAIKTLMFQDASEAKRIRQRAITEAAINSVLTHDNIVNTFAHDLRPVVGGGMPDEQHAACWKLYIIQEYCNGGSLAQAIDKRVFIDSRTKMNNMLLILKVAEDIARGMTYIHENNVIHGDLSSGNVLLRYDPQAVYKIQAKVGDFGLSRFLEGPGHSHISNVRQGTPFYIAPEVLNRGVISKPADVFSFGVLLWEMFCGTPPWRDPALTAFQDTLNPLVYPYHVPRSCPVEYHALIMACLAENPKERPTFPELLRKVSDLLAMLQQAVSDHHSRQQQQQQQPEQQLLQQDQPKGQQQQQGDQSLLLASSGKAQQQPLMVVGDMNMSPQLTEMLEKDGLKRF